ncbi:MAG: retron St85 family RNA-directed DNA polymerase [Candidatus Thiodiazotropha taylori]
MNLKEKILLDLKIPDTLFDEAIFYSYSRVKKFHIPKKSGGFRTICQPSNKLKTIQYWLINNLFNNLPVDKSAFAYIEGKSIVDNAKHHNPNQYFLKVDLKDFFPSIQYKDLKPVIKEWHDSCGPEWPFNRTTERIIKRSCFNNNNRLPIGYPSSPIISNIVMKPFDIEVDNLISRKQYINVRYSRYADDLIFSTNKKGICNLLLNDIKKLIINTKSPNIKINNNKINFSSAKGGSTILTGIRVAYDNHLTLHKKQKDHIRLLLSLYKKNALDESEFESLKGHIFYSKFIDPAFYTKIQNKFFKEINELTKL